MSENLHYHISRTPKFGVNDLCILAHASRNVDPKQVKSENLASSSKLLRQKLLRDQMCEAIRNFNDLNAPSQRSSHLPLNMIVSKTVTRKALQEKNADPLEGFDLSNIRKSKLLELPQPWREKNVNRKRLQSDYLHNKRKIEEIQAMKAKLKCPQYDPDDLKRRHHDLQHVLSESEPFPRKEQDTSPEGRFSQLNDGCRRLPLTKPLVMLSEDPLSDDVIDDNQSIFEHVSNHKENPVSSSNPIFHQTKDKFVWNPIILPVANSFSSASELLEYYYPPRVEGNSAKEWFDSPGNHTTSSTSSGLTVAEETVRLTYYAERGRAPSKEQSRTRSGNYSFMCDPSETTAEERLPHCCRSAFMNCFEE